MTTDTIASFGWDLHQIPLLLRDLSDSMTDEVNLLRELEPVGSAAQRLGQESNVDTLLQRTRKRSLW